MYLVNSTELECTGLDCMEGLEYKTEAASQLVIYESKSSVPKVIFRLSQIIDSQTLPDIH